MSFYKSYLYVFITFLFFSTTTLAQNHSEDSLKLRLQSTINDFDKAMIYFELSEICEIKDIESYSKEGIRLCEKHLKKKIISPKLFNEYLSLKYSLMQNLAVAFNYNGNQKKALNIYYECLSAFDKLKDEVGYANTLFNISLIFSDMYEYETSIKYIEKSLVYFTKQKDSIAIAQCLDGLTKNFTMTKNFDQAFSYGQQSLVFNKRKKSNIGISRALSNLGAIYLELGNPKKALSMFVKSLQTQSRPYNGFNIMPIYKNLGESFLRLKQFKEAKFYFLKCYQTAKQIHSPIFIKACAEKLAMIYEKEGNYKKACFMHKIVANMSLKINTDDLKKQSIKKDLQYEYEKKIFQNKLAQEKTVNELKLESEKKDNRKNTLLLTLTSVLILILSSAVFWYRSYKQKQSIKDLEKNELKQKALLSQMSPHFIFNSISNIKGLIRNKDDERAMTYLDEFSLLTRQVLEHSRENYISIEEEISMITNYLNIQQLLLNNSFVYELKVSENINKEATFIPPMLTQPFIENAIKHGAREGIKGNVEIQFILDTQNKLLVSVKDNGKGFSDKQTQTEHKSLALKITKQRLEQYNASTFIVFENVMSEKREILGAKILFEMPYIYEG